MNECIAFSSGLVARFRECSEQGQNSKHEFKKKLCENSSNSCKITDNQHYKYSIIIYLFILGDASNADFPSKMAQLAAICKIQLDQEST